MNRSATGTATRPCHTSLRSRLGLPASAYSCFSTVLLMSLVLLTLGLLIAAPARAGQWVVTYECSGSSSYMKVPEDQPKTTTGPFPNNWPTTFDSTTQCPPGADDYSPIFYYYPGYLGVDPDSDTRLLLSSASNSGSMVAVLTWTADSATDTSLPPLNVNVIETAQVVAAVDTFGHSYSVAASDSLGDVAVPITSGDGWNDYGLMASGQHLLALNNPTRQQVLRLPSRSFSASASGGPNSDGFQENFSQADVTYKVDQDTLARDVTISSPTIEDSYQKTNNPETFGSDIHVRDPFTGAMTVESVVTTSGGEFVVSPSVYGDTFKANTLNFQHPYYTWSIPTAGGRIGQYTQQYLGVESDQYVTIPVNIYFGRDATLFPVTSLLKVDVRDTDNATGSNTYNVIWHLPVENWAALGPSTNGSNRIFPEPGKDSAGNTNMQVNETVDVMLHTKEDDLDYGPGLKVLSVFLGGASPFLPAAIEGPWGLALSGLAGAASVTTGFLIPADPAQDHTPNGGTFYAEYVAGVQIQKQINDNNAAGYPDNSTPRFIPSDPPSVSRALADIAAAQGHYDQDLEFNSGHMWATEFTGYSTTVQNYQGDAYDIHGYAGNANGTDRKDKTLFYVFTWHRGTP